MKKYIKNFIDFYGYDETDWIGCMVCNSTSCDIHHITYRSQGGSDDVSNLISLCRRHHNQAHFKNEPYLEKEDLKEIVKMNIKQRLRELGK